MPLEFRCVTCAKMLRVGDDAVGKKARCPDCGTIQDVMADFRLASPFSAPASAVPSVPEAATPPASFVDPNSPFGSPPAQAKLNPFADTGSYTGSHAVPNNPYSAPSHAAAYPGELGSNPGNRLIAESKARPPAVAMMVVQGIALCWTMFQVAAIVLQGLDGGEWNNEVFAFTGVVVTGTISGLVLIGAIHMYRLRGYGLAMAAAIISLLPCTGCCILTLPIGIWALVVLNDPIVKSSFE